MKHSLHAWVVSCAIMAGASVATAQESFLPLPQTPPLAYYQQPVQPQVPQYQQRASHYVAQYQTPHYRNGSSAYGFTAYDQANDWSRAQAMQANNPSDPAQNVVYNSAAWNQAMTGNYGTCGTGCDSCATGCGTGCGDCCGPTWLISARALVMTRVSGDPFHFDYESTTPSVCLLRSDDPGLDWWQGGIDVTAERRFGCFSGVQLNYWTLAPSDDEIVLSVPGGVLNTTINLSPIPGVTPITFAGAPLSDYFDGAGAQSLRRTNEIHSAEINYTHQFAISGPNRPFATSVLAGFRYFRFDEGLLFGSVQNGFQFGDNGGLNEAYYDIDTLNNLYGLQGGGQIERFMFGRLRMYANAKAGVFYNDAEQHSQIYRGDGLVALDIASSQDVLSFIAQIDVGLNAEIFRWLRADIGYRALGVSGVALSEEQIPPFIHDTPGILDVNTGGSLILHGGYAGFTALW